MDTCTFTKEMSTLFAQLSQDRNPMHLDDDVARRTYFGETIVHGIHLLLQGCELICIQVGRGYAPRQLKASFNKPVATGSNVEYAIVKDPSAGLFRLNGICQGRQVFRAVLYMQRCEGPPEVSYFDVCDGVASEDINVAATPWELDQAELDGLSAEVRVELPLAADAARLFPAMVGSWPRSFLHGMLFTTYIVGMRAPGLNSIFSNLDISWDYTSDGADPENATFRVTDLHPTIRRCEIEAQGAGWRATLQAFIRPKPCVQPRYVELAARVAPGTFASQRALVLGGSRGIGEVTCKLLAAGGADVVLTYARSAKNAEAVAGEINDGGGKARTVKFEAGGGVAIAGVLPIGWRPTHLYYFVTPPIVGDRYDFSDKYFNRYLLYYSTFFASLVSELRQGSEELSDVLWPSSVAVTEVPSGMVEYAMAKSAGEILCQALMRANPDLVIHTPRLPRIRTDLTANPLVADGAVASEVMLPILIEIFTATNKSGK